MFDIGIPPELSTCPEPPAEEAGEGVWIPTANEAVKYDPGSIEYGVPFGERGRYALAPVPAQPGGVSVGLDHRAALGSSWGVSVYAGVAQGIDPADPGQWWPCHEGEGTSVGAADSVYWLAEALPWGDDACWRWGTPLGNGTRPVVVAWTREAWDPATCTYSDAVIWAASSNGIAVLAGDTGEIIDSAALPLDIDDLVVDAAGDAWGLARGQALLHIDRATLVATVHPLVAADTGWALAIDHEGRPWVCDGTGAVRWSGSAWETTGAWNDDPEPGALLDPANAQGCTVDRDDVLRVVAEYPAQVGGQVGPQRLRHITADLEPGWGELMPSTDGWGQPQRWGGLSITAQGGLWSAAQGGERVLRLTGDARIGAWVEGAELVGDGTGQELWWLTPA